jgi:hypothetical protein
MGPKPGEHSEQHQDGSNEDFRRVLLHGTNAERSRSGTAADSDCGRQKGRLNTTKARKRKRAAAVACTDLLECAASLERDMEREHREIDAHLAKEEYGHAEYCRGRAHAFALASLRVKRLIHSNSISMFSPKSPVEPAAPRDSLFSWGNYERAGGSCQPVRFSSKGR